MLNADDQSRSRVWVIWGYSYWVATGPLVVMLLAAGKNSLGLLLSSRIDYISSVWIEVSRRHSSNHATIECTRLSNRGEYIDLHPPDMGSNLVNVHLL